MSEDVSLFVGRCFVGPAQNGAASIVSAISSVITGKPSDEDEDDFEEYEKF